MQGLTQGNDVYEFLLRFSLNFISRNIYKTIVFCQKYFIEADDGSDNEMNEENLLENEDLATEKKLVNFNLLFIAIIRLLIIFF